MMGQQEQWRTQGFQLKEGILKRTKEIKKMKEHEKNMKKREKLSGEGALLRDLPQGFPFKSDKRYYIQEMSQLGQLLLLTVGSTIQGVNVSFILMTYRTFSELLKPVQVEWKLINQWNPPKKIKFLIYLLLEYSIDFNKLHGYKKNTWHTLHHYYINLTNFLHIIL